MHTADKRAIALIPCYNSRKYIRQAVLGLLNQTHPLDLIVVLNDGSTDGFQEEIADLVEKHCNLIIHNNPGNLGRSGCRNEGFEQFPADFYFLNDADDVSLPTRVEKTLACMAANPDCGIVAGYVEYIDGESRVFSKGTQMYCMSKEDSARYRNSMEPIGLFCSTVCLRGEVIHRDGLRFDTSLPACEDMELWNLTLEKGWDILCLPEFLSQYRMHSNSIFTSQFIFCKHHHMYVEDRMIRRRTGQSTISFDEFMNNKKSGGIWSWMRFEYPIWAEHFYRTGGYHLISGNRIMGACMLTLALLMKPGRIRRAIRQRLGKKV